MASINTITDVIASIKAVYAYFAQDTNVKLLVGVWHGLLKNYTDEEVKAAVFKCLQTCKKPPTPADVIEQITALKEVNEPSDEELWSEFTRALYQVEKEVYYFRFTFVEANGKTQGDNARARVEQIWQDLPDRLKRYVGSKGELMRLAMNRGEDELKFEKTRFLKSMPIIKKREEYAAFNLLTGNETFLLE